MTWRQSVHIVTQKISSGVANCQVDNSILVIRFYKNGVGGKQLIVFIVEINFIIHFMCENKLLPKAFPFGKHILRKCGHINLFVVFIEVVNFVIHLYAFYFFQQIYNSINMRTFPIFDVKMFWLFGTLIFFGYLGAERHCLRPQCCNRKWK